MDIRDISTIRMAVVGGYGYTTEENQNVSGESIVVEEEVTDSYSLESFNNSGSFDNGETLLKNTTGTAGNIIQDNNNYYYAVNGKLNETNTVVLEINIASFTYGSYSFNFDVLSGLSNSMILIEVDGKIIGTYDEYYSTDISSDETINLKYDFYIASTKKLNVKITFITKNNGSASIDNINISKR